MGCRVDFLPKSVGKLTAKRHIALMRFVFLLSLMGLLAEPVWAQPGQTYSLEETVTPRSPIVSHAKITRQVRSSQNAPQTIAGFQISRTASNLGEISAMALAKDGTIFTADETKGRITRLSDRGQDGQIDTTRVIASGLTAPSGIAVIDNWVYIADATAIWRVDQNGGAPELFVSLQNTGAMTSPRPLLVNILGNQLMLGLSSKDGNAKIVTIDLDTKRADLMTVGPGRITALAGLPKGPFWAGMSGALVPIMDGQPLNIDTGQNLEQGTEIGGLILPGQFDNPAGWPDEARDDIIATQSGTDNMSARSSGGFNVISIPTHFGQPSSEIQILIDGFLTRTRRSAWGQPGAMVMDARGLFIADRWSGNVWRLSKARPKPVIVVEPEPEAIVANTETEDEDEAIRGSGIGAGSQIDTASKLDVGSIMAKEYEAREAERKAANEAKKNKKKSKKLDKSAIKHSLD